VGAGKMRSERCDWRGVAEKRSCVKMMKVIEAVTVETYISNFGRRIFEIDIVTQYVQQSLGDRYVSMAR
jgi:hypothetical protein